jgi:CheY-like chemotaxis protein
MNLAVNARDAMGSVGTMSLAVDEVTLDDAYLHEHPHVSAGRYVRFTITDTGCGMDEDVRQKIFEPYFTTKRDRSGTGLGLASVYWIVAQSGGHIDVKSAVGQGTTFSLFFPVSNAAAPARQRRVRTLSTVLVVLGNPEEARKLEDSLTERGHRVVSADGALAALELARRGQDDMDLLVADVVLTGMNGIELERELRKIAPNLGVLLLSGDGSGVLAVRGILGEDEGVVFLQRPVSTDTVAKTVYAMLRKRRKRPQGGNGSNGTRETETEADTDGTEASGPTRADKVGENEHSAE